MIKVCFKTRPSKGRLPQRALTKYEANALRCFAALARHGFRDASQSVVTQKQFVRYLLGLEHGKYFRDKAATERTVAELVQAKIIEFSPMGNALKIDWLNEEDADPNNKFFFAILQHDDTQAHKPNYFSLYSQDGKFTTLSNSLSPASVTRHDSGDTSPLTSPALPAAPHPSPATAVRSYADVARGLSSRLVDHLPPPLMAEGVGSMSLATGSPTSPAAGVGTLQSPTGAAPGHSGFFAIRRTPSYLEIRANLMDIMDSPPALSPADDDGGDRSSFTTSRPPGLTYAAEE